MAFLHFTISYNPLERRESCKGGREANKKLAQSQPSAKGSTAPKSQSSNNARRNCGSSANNANQAAKAPKPSSNGGAAYDEQITELKLSIDGLEKERDFYFAKLRDIEILCQSPEIEHLPVVAAIQKILYATDDDAAVVAEAQSMISVQQKEAEQLSPIVEVSEEKSSSEKQKRKNVVNPDFDAAGITTLSPRQRLYHVSDVHCSGKRGRVAKVGRKEGLKRWIFDHQQEKDGK
ncbi:microtubule-associated protein RP/EB family member 1C [Senna tora]|uniref:Microtubule-associated protein RP/EB family member 1C n=1 Tax=Senna tora TaxID=362788 RepID=A0A834TYI4_9FABA|nr:microtubule-associated protein RP/EB family member 1C [Senna tora]